MNAESLSELIQRPIDHDDDSYRPHSWITFSLSYFPRALRLYLLLGELERFSTITTAATTTSDWCDISNFWVDEDTVKIDGKDWEVRFVVSSLGLEKGKLSGCSGVNFMLGWIWMVGLLKFQSHQVLSVIIYAELKPAVIRDSAAFFLVGLLFWCFESTGGL